ncbi:MAG: hypothetical protein H6581_18395 [Bacteroidia bacterium]|nr:hypothetical protein [Bacteroidia bacterium]
MSNLKTRIEHFIEAVRDLKVCVVGETIIDQFVPVSYEGQSMKSNCPVLKLEGEMTTQTGGSGAIAGHLRDFVKQVDLITNENGEIVKTRYVDIHDQRKHVEINKFDVKDFGRIEVPAGEYDVVIVADFGHHFLNDLVVHEPFHLMCQTNSNNFGYNRISKWKAMRNKSICLDLREASLQMNRRVMRNPEEEILELYGYEMNTELLFLTIGRKGSMFTNGKQVFTQSSFASEIVDTIGAGDTFFSFAALAAEVLDDSEGIMEIPALAASLSTTWLCNENSVTRERLLNYANRFL